MTYPCVGVAVLAGCRVSMTYLRVIFTGLAGFGKYDLLSVRFTVLAGCRVSMTYPRVGVAILACCRVSMTYPCVGVAVLAG
jgi:hypothetical protein